jgi:SAM-dependent methyltransferase
MIISPLQFIFNMDYRLLDLLRCPLTKTKLRFELIAEFERTYGSKVIIEAREGILYSESGFVFPVIAGVPRMLIEAFDDYQDWLARNMKDFEQVRSKLQTDYPGLIKHCRAKNYKTKQSFAYEWSLLNYEKQDKIWHDDDKGLEELFFRESKENADSLKVKAIIDVGCGHGMNARAISGYCDLVVGAELGKSIENAYKYNDRENAWFVQADLEFLPFANDTFDVLLSGGVLHHTRNTELALSAVEPSLKREGKLCVWLYHPQKSIIHKLLNNLRKFTSRWPVRLQFCFYLISIFPVTYTFKRLKGRKLNWREEMIDLMDTLSPLYRHEHRQDEAAAWLQKRGYRDICVTTESNYGFSIIGTKK